MARTRDGTVGLVAVWRRPGIRAVGMCVGLFLIVGQLVSSGSIGASGGTMGGAAAPSAKHVTAQRAAVDSAYGKLPLAFAANAGQARDPGVRFVAQGNGYSLALGSQQVTLALAGTQAASHSGSAKANDAATLVSRMSAPGPKAQVSGAAVSMRWIGSNPAPALSGEQQLPGAVNYFVGNDPSKWRANIATYAQVRYSNVYPGIDLVYYGSQAGQLEYDFVVSPGADPSRIQLDFDGTQGATLDAQGNLQLRLANGQTLEQQAPSVYQTVNGARQGVSGGFILAANGTVGFQVAAYDRAMPLVIDPVYRFGTYLGGGFDDESAAIAIDYFGNAYIAGFTASSDFPTTSGAFQTSQQGDYDAFVSKFNANGTALVYSTYLGGAAANDAATSIAVDGAGNAYIAGHTASTNFPTTMGAFQTTYGGGPNDGFVTKLNATGSGLVYSTYLGGSGDDFATGITLDGGGNAYITGYTASTNFPTHTAEQGTNAGGKDAFLTKLNATGSGLVYSTYLGGSGDEQGSSIALDGSGNAYITGYTASTNFPTHTPEQATNAGGQDAFVTKLSASGTSLIYSTYVGGSANDSGNSIALDSGGSAYITGFTFSSNYPVTGGAFQSANLAAPFTAFVSKLSPAGNSLGYSTYLGGSSLDVGTNITVDGAGYAYVVGVTASSDFPLANPIQSKLGGSGASNAFIVRLNPSGGALVFGSYLGGSGSDVATGVALGPASTVYLTGLAASTDFPVHNALQSTNHGPNDAFVAKINVLPNAVQTVGAYDASSGTFYLRTSNSGGPANLAFPFGPPGCTPIAGDWNGKGYDSVGVYCPSSGTFYLKNANSGGSADFAFPFGPPNCLPLVGDWTGKNYDSVGVDCNGIFYMRNLNAGGNADAVFGYGPTSGCAPVAGDWTAKGYDSMGVYCSGTFYLRNSNTPGNADIGVAFGPTSGCVADTGDWTGKGYDSIGVDCSGTYYLRNSNTAGNADIAFPYGASSFKPLAGEWVPAPGSVAVHRNPATKSTGPLPKIPSIPGR